MSDNASRPTVIPLGNGWRIRLNGVRLGEDLSDALTLQGYIAATRDGGPIDASLAAPAVSEGGGTGDYHADLASTDALAAYLHTRVYVVGESVPAGGYREVFPVTVIEAQQEEP